jgi:mono/diheme cytochrome c family protein
MPCMKSRCEDRHAGRSRLAPRTRTVWRSACRLMTIAAIVSLSGCRLDMHVQPRYDPEAPSVLFSDGRSARLPVVGTVARGELHIDDLLYRGMIGGKEADVFPFPITAADLARGHERYDIYCSPCHDYTGSGNGMIVQRGFPHPPSYHSDRLRQAPVGHFFAVMTNGFGKMYSYAARISPEDRWRIAAYIRALQLSEHASVQDVPAAQQERLKP